MDNFLLSGRRECLDHRRFVKGVTVAFILQFPTNLRVRVSSRPELTFKSFESGTFSCGFVIPVF